MKYLPELFDNNRRWAERKTAQDAAYFSRLTAIQRPRYLWIGCADSRVPANEIVGLAPGELFVHRNVANLVHLEDPNCMAVVQFAVESLGVEHIIVCGHYGCGGVKAAAEGNTRAHIAVWLGPLGRLARANGIDLKGGDAAEQWKRLCELNVKEQVRILTESDYIHGAWASGRNVCVHGWIYALDNGLLRDLDVSVSR